MSSVVRFAEVICIQPIEIFLGERRVVTVEISSCDSEPFTIRDPTYKFKLGDFVESEGVPIVQDHELTFILEPQRSGRYEVECRMEIGNEIIKRTLPVFVRE